METGLRTEGVLARPRGLPASRRLTIAWVWLIRSSAQPLRHGRAPRRELAPASLLTVGVAALLLGLGPAPGDAPAHLYRTLLVQHGSPVWDNFWYAGYYPLVSYSLLYYLPAALDGNLPLVIAGAVLSTVLLAGIAYRVWVGAAVWPTRVFGVFAAAPLFRSLTSADALRCAKGRGSELELDVKLGRRRGRSRLSQAVRSFATHSNARPESSDRRERRCGR